MKIEIWSDVVCPWCYIGKRRFEAALARFPERSDVRVIWRSFELDPAAPSSPDAPGDYAAHLAAKYRTSREGAQAMIDNVTAVATSEGLDFRFDLARRGNTFDAHRLLHFALEKGVQDELEERLDRGTFTEGLAVSNPDDLAGAAADVGLDLVEVKDVLTSDRYADAVRADEAQARAYGITGVPFFVLAGRVGVSGAQPAEALLGALEHAYREAPATL